MFVTVHALTGIAIVSAIPNPLISLPLTFGSHFLLDNIPHWHLDPEKVSRKTLDIAGTFDFVLATVITLFLFRSIGNTHFLWGAFLASIMDLDAVLYHRVYLGGVKWRLFPSWLSTFHAKVQRESNIWMGISSQIAVIVISSWIIYA